MSISYVPTFLFLLLYICQKFNKILGVPLKYVYVTGKLRSQAFHEMPKNFSHFLKHFSESKMVCKMSTVLTRNSVWSIRPVRYRDYLYT